MRKCTLFFLYLANICTVLMYELFCSKGEESDHMGVKRTRGGKLATPRDPEDPAMRKMFAGNLHKDTTQEALKAFFSEFGEVEQCYCAMNKTTGKCKGYGFVTYRQSEAVDAIQSSRPHSLLDREVDTRRAVPRELAGNPESEMRSFYYRWG